MRRCRALFATLTVIAASLMVPTSGAAEPVVAVAFHGLTPARLLDTRSGPGLATIDGRFFGGGQVGANSVLDLTVVGRGGVPANGVGAVALNVVATESTLASFLTVFPTGAVRPNAANLNFDTGATIPNSVIVPVGADGQVSIYNLAGQVHLVVDVLGWFPTSSSSGAVAFTGLTPARLLETRSDAGLATIDGQFLGQGRAAPNSTLGLTVTGRGGVPATGVGAVVLNVAATGASLPTFLTVFPTGAAKPNAANLNIDAAATIANMVVVPVGTDGQVSIYNLAGQVDVVVDVLGWFPITPPFGSASFTGLTPARLLETRAEPGLATIDGEFLGTGPVPGGSSFELKVVGRGGVPATGVGAVALNVAVTGSTAPSYLTVYPAGAARPNAASLNFVAGQTIPNSVIVPVGAGGQIDLYNFAGSTDIVVDVQGWFPTTAVPSTTTMISTRVGVGGSSNAASSQGPSTSADGRWVAFTSFSTNLLTGVSDLNAAQDVFLTDRSTGRTTLVSFASGASTDAAAGASSNPSISVDGRYIVFNSGATNLVAGDTNGRTDVFLHDRISGLNSKISNSLFSGPTNGDSSGLAAISADGRFVVYASDADNIVTSDTNGQGDIFRFDRQSGLTSRLSLGGGGAQGNGPSSGPRLSANGLVITFTSTASNLVTTPDTNATSDLFVIDLTTANPVVERLSTAMGSVAAANGESLGGSISADGSLVVYTSSASNLVAGDTNATNDVFLVDRRTNTTRRVSLGVSGEQAGGASTQPTISADGRTLAFRSEATNLVVDDTNGVADIFVRPTGGGATSVISRASDGTQSTGFSNDPALSADGRFVGFFSIAPALAPGDTNMTFDVFIHDRGTS